MGFCFLREIKMGAWLCLSPFLVQFNGFCFGLCINKLLFFYTIMCIFRLDCVSIKTKFYLRCSSKCNFYVAIQFLTHIFYKFFKNFKIAKSNKNSKNICSWYICIIFSIFSVVLKKFKFLKVFWTRFIFNALFLKLLIFFIE